jgi:hypothetical protein
MIIGATGHQNIPAAASPQIAHTLEQALRRYATALTGVCSLADGADQLFAGLVLELGGQLHVVVPCEGYERTMGTSVARERFKALLSRAHRVENLPFRQPSQSAFLAAGQHVVDLSRLLIAIWDGQDARGEGGTGDIVKYARSVGREIIVLWPEGVVRK